MKRLILLLGVSIFAIFVGSQITEGALFVPYWKSMSPEEFHEYYNEYGPMIGRFYTVLTIIAALIPILLTLYCKKHQLKGGTEAAISAFLAILFVSCFYIYFKGANAAFYNDVMDAQVLQDTLQTWSLWHWGRVIIECLSLFFLIKATDSVLSSKA